MAAPCCLKAPRPGQQGAVLIPEALPKATAESLGQYPSVLDDDGQMLEGAMDQRPAVVDRGDCCDLALEVQPLAFVHRVLAQAEHTEPVDVGLLNQRHIDGGDTEHRANLEAVRAAGGGAFVDLAAF